MSVNNLRINRALTLVLSVMFAATFAVTAQTTTTTSDSSTGNSQSSSSAQARSRTISNGQKTKLRGVVTRRDADTFTVQETDNSETIVRLTDRTTVAERKSNPFRRARNYGVTNILRGLNVEVEGRGDAAGQLVADRVRFSEDERRVAQTVEARVNPVEDRVSQTEQNAQRISGQLDELAAVSNAARGGAKAAQDTADAAVAGVNATNERISSLDDYAEQGGVTINFRVGSSVLSPESKAQLSQVATQALTIRGYIIEVRGFADATGGVEANRRLSQQRADAVVRYMVENHNIPLRRITTPFGYGESQAVADNTTRDGRAQNRRVEVKVLVNRGLNQPAPTVNSSTSQTSSTTPN
ncbi:MAG: OmpA family protein [Pyrinomonadaceae bacterium]|nr:OmpA family protein [Pyrinomonadaceae bacterium]